MSKNKIGVKDVKVYNYFAVEERETKTYMCLLCVISRIGVV